MNSEKQIQTSGRPEFDLGNEDYPLEDWKYQVANGDTILGYVDWVCHQVESEGTIWDSFHW